MLRFIIALLIKVFGINSVLCEVIDIGSKSNTNIRNISKASASYADLECKRLRFSSYTGPQHYSPVYMAIQMAWIEAYKTALCDNNLTFDNGYIVPLTERLTVTQREIWAKEKEEEIKKEFKDKLREIIPDHRYNVELILSKL